MLKIHGFQKLTLLDYPGKVACTVFLGGCNFRCPFCHNGNLVQNPQEEPVILRSHVLETLKKRRGILDGVCITGGEPALAEELPEFMEEIKDMGFLIKLDTNGSRPEVVKKLIRRNLVDYVAMDIKNTLEKYPLTCGVPEVDRNSIRETVDMLREGTLEYEFRTTVTKELHQKEDLLYIGEWLKGSKKYALQAYRESPQVIRPVFTSYSRKELEQFGRLLEPYVECVEIRGL